MRPRGLPGVLSQWSVPPDPTGGTRRMTPPHGLPGTCRWREGIAIADNSGLPVSSLFTTKANVLTVAAMATMAVQSSQRVYQNLGLAGPSEVVMVRPRFDRLHLRGQRGPALRDRRP